MRNISDKSCRVNQNKRYVFNNSYFENRAVYEIIWETILETDDSIAHAHCMLGNYGHTDLQYVIPCDF